MTALELLAPARNADIGIAAVDCGADAVYIAGPAFGARKDAPNEIEDVRRLCQYAHRFGVRIFLTVNITLSDDELPQVHSQMLQAQDAGVDAFIIRDERITGWKDIRVPLHASTQCAIRTVERALHFQRLGCSRIVLERALPLETVREICSAVSCEVEFFVHGALCVCYSGDCRLSEYIDSRSADRGECIQACRSLYNLEDENGKVLVRNKALLSLKDFNLKNRLEELAEAGVMSFKIEGRLKNASYVKNITRSYSDALDALCAKYPDRYRRASWGHPVGGFTPDPDKTFNRGYTEFFLDGKRGDWSSMNAPKSMGEVIGTVASIRNSEHGYSTIDVKPLKPGLRLGNGDGLAFISKDSITGFRADLAEGLSLRCRPQKDLKPGMTLYRNLNTAFEKSLESNMCHREIPVALELTIKDGKLTVNARTEDGRKLSMMPEDAPSDIANNVERVLSMIRSGLSKKTGIYSFELLSLDVEGAVPLLSSAFINGIRRDLAAMLDRLPLSAEFERRNEEGECICVNGSADRGDELMRTRYCVRYQLGMCPKWQGAKGSGRLFLENNGRRFALNFHCKECEMTLTPVQN